MRAKLIKEPVFSIDLWCICDCNQKELRNWIIKKFGSKIEIDKIGVEKRGVFVTVTDTEEGTRDYIVWSNDTASMSHEIIHFVMSIFRFHSIPLNRDTEEVFCKLHGYYYRECLKVLNAKENKTKTVKLKNIKDIEEMSKHDKVVYEETQKMLEEGSDSIEIGYNVVARKYIAESLKEKYSNAHIFYWITDKIKIEVT